MTFANFWWQAIAGSRCRRGVTAGPVNTLGVIRT